MSNTETENGGNQHTEVKGKKGYKKTKLGWIPEEWDVNFIKDIGKIGSGNTPSKANKQYWDNGKIPWLPTGKVNDKIIHSSETFITQFAVQDKSISLLPINTILLAMIGQGKTRGKSAILKIEAWVNQNFAYIIPKKSLYPSYLFSFLDYNYQRIRYEGQRGGSQGSLNLHMVKFLRILVPPLPEQKAIASCLSTWDNATTNFTQLIKKKQQLKKALIQQLLSGEKRLPGFNGVWEESKFNDIGERVMRKNIEANDTVVTISAKRGFVLQEDFFNKRVASNTLLNYTLVKKGEYCYNKSYSNGYPMGAFKRLNDFDNAVVTTLYICFSLKDNVDSDFMNQYFEAGKMIPGLLRIAQEGGRAHGLLNISLPDFFSLPVKLPKLEEQTAIAQVLNTADKEIQLLTTQRNQLKLQKKGLMQQLLTGKKRLKF